MHWVLTQIFDASIPLVFSLRDAPSLHAVMISPTRTSPRSLYKQAQATRSRRTQARLAIELQNSAMESILVSGLMKSSDETDTPRRIVM